MKGINDMISHTKPMLRNYVKRYKLDKAILEKGGHSKDAIELLKKRIERHKQDIVDYVTSEHFEYALYNLNL